MKNYKKNIDEREFKSYDHPKTINLVAKAFKENYRINKSYAIPISDMINKIMAGENADNGEMDKHKIHSAVNRARMSIENLMCQNYIKIKSGRHEACVVPKKSLLYLIEKQNS